VPRLPWRDPGAVYAASVTPASLPSQVRRRHDPDDSANLPVVTLRQFDGKTPGGFGFPRLRSRVISAMNG
jgi:hypothetical protein